MSCLSWPVRVYLDRRNIELNDCEWKGKNVDRGINHFLFLFFFFLPSSFSETFGRRLRSQQLHPLLLALWEQQEKKVDENRQVFSPFFLSFFLQRKKKEDFRFSLRGMIYATWFLVLFCIWEANSVHIHYYKQALAGIVVSYYCSR